MPSPLQTAAISTFESLALLFADPAPSAAQRAVPLAAAVRVAFTGPVSGTLSIAVSDDVAVALAANMLGLEPDEARHDPALRRDALGELANVVCGNVLPLVAGREAVFHLAAPAPVSLDALAPVGAPASGPALAESLGVESGQAHLSLQFDSPIPAALAPAFAAAGLAPALAASPGSATLPATAPLSLVP